jgi:hypothetical protein
MSAPTPVGQARQVRQPVVVAATLVCAASMLGLGLWAFLDPPSFSGFADFAPYTSTSSMTPAPSRSASAPPCWSPCGGRTAWSSP